MNIAVLASPIVSQCLLHMPQFLPQVSDLCKLAALHNPSPPATCRAISVMLSLLQQPRLMLVLTIKISSFLAVHNGILSISSRNGGPYLCSCFCSQEGYAFIKKQDPAAINASGALMIAI